MVPGSSLLSMAISAIIAFGLPIALFFIFKLRFKTRILPLLLGIAGFVIFAMLLEQGLHLIVLRPDANGKIALMTTNPALYVVYGCLAAGVFEETARFLMFHILKRLDNRKAVPTGAEVEIAVPAENGKERGVGDALSYGIGHGGIEAVLVLGVTMIGNLVYSAIINSGANLPGGAQSTAAIVQALTTTPPHMFLVGGLERVFAIAIQISLSVVVWYAVNGKRRVWLYPLAILLHAVVDIPAAMTQCGVLKSILVVETLVGVSALLMVFVAVSVHKRFRAGAADETV